MMGGCSVEPSSEVVEACSVADAKIGHVGRSRDESLGSWLAGRDLRTLSRLHAALAMCCRT